MNLFLFFIVCEIFTFNLIQCFKPRRTENYPPKAILDITKPMHDECIENTGVTEEAITHFSDCHVDDINENDEKLKCYMHCLFHKFEHYELSREVDELDFFTTDEVTILLDMGEKCENFEYNNEHDEKCEYAFKLNKCWKFVNPEYYFLV